MTVTILVALLCALLKVVPALVAALLLLINGLTSAVCALTSKLGTCNVALAQLNLPAIVDELSGLVTVLKSSIQSILTEALSCLTTSLVGDKALAEIKSLISADLKGLTQVIKVLFGGEGSFQVCLCALTGKQLDITTLCAGLVANVASLVAVVLTLVTGLLGGLGLGNLGLGSLL